MNYWWHLRPFDTPAWLNHAVFLLGNALYGAALSLRAFGSDRLRLAALTAALIVLGPQTVLMTGWFNTLIPGIWIAAAFAVLTLPFGLRVCRLLLFLFVPLTLIAYSTYPLLLLLVCLLHRDAGRNLGEFIKTMAAFAAAFAFGMVVMFGLNWLIHGVFGLRYVSWRSATPAHNLAGVIANLPLLRDFLSWTFSGLGFGHAWLAAANMVAFFIALIVIAQRRPVEALSILTGALAGLLLLSVLSLKDGVYIFFRSTQFVWAAYAIALARAVVLSGSEPRARHLAAALVATTAASAVYTAMVHRVLIPFQQETRRIAAAIPNGAAEVRIFGSFNDLPEAVAANIQHDDAIRFRIWMLTGLPTIACSTEPETCANPQPPLKLPKPGEPTTVEARGTIAFIQLPGPPG